MNPSLSAQPEPAVVLQQLTLDYDTRSALQKVTFSIPQGSLFGLLGANGSGKTTLFRILSTLIHPSAGEALVLGNSVVEHPQATRKQLGSVFQQPALDDDLTVQENLKLHGALYGLRGPSLINRLDTLTSLFDVKPRLHERVKTLSGGLKRRVDLVRGLLHQPDILLLDEPTTGLDPLARRTFWDHIYQLRKQEQTTIIVATHLMEEAEGCDHIAILDEGQLRVTGTPEGLKAALGDQLLWITSKERKTLTEQIKEHLDLDASVVGDRVQISTSDGASLVPELYARYGPLIVEVTVRKPTLEDVFILHTKH